MEKEIPILILAAGSSQRLGEPKQLLELRGKTLIDHAIDEAIAANLGKVFVVTGFEHSLLKSELKDKPSQIIFNPRWKEGMGTSISKGIALIQDLEYTSVIIAICDQAYLTSKIYEKLAQGSILSGKGIVYSDYGNAYGPPVYFAKRYFPELVKLEGEYGAKALIHKYNNDSVGISFPKGFIDIDTSEDYNDLLDAIS